MSNFARAFSSISKHGPEEARSGSYETIERGISPVALGYQRVTLEIKLSREIRISF